MARNTLFMCALLAFSTPFLSGQEPLTIQAIIPPYPPLGRVARLSGSVEIEVLVDSKGRVASILPQKADAKLRQFVPYSESFAKRWLFSSASTGSLTIKFIYELFPRSTEIENLGSEFIAPRTVVIRATSSAVEAPDHSHQTGVNIVKDK